MKAHVVKGKSEQKVTQKVNELLNAGGQIVGRIFQAEEEIHSGKKGRPKTMKLFYWSMMIPEEIENVNLGNDDIEQDYFA